MGIGGGGEGEGRRGGGGEEGRGRGGGEGGGGTRITNFHCMYSALQVDCPCAKLNSDT